MLRSELSGTEDLCVQTEQDWYVEMNLLGWVEEITLASAGECSIALE